MSITRRLEFIARTQLTGTAASVSFANLDTDFRKFFLVIYHVNDGTSGKVLLRCNNDSGANYAYQRLSASSTTVAGARTTGATSLDLGFDANANQKALITCEISKPVAAEVARSTSKAAPYDGTNILLAAFAGEWTNTADLISRIDLVASGGNFTTGTRILLYGSRD